MRINRPTAIVQFELPSSASPTMRTIPLDTGTNFGVILIIEGESFSSDNFRSPINDAEWREFIYQLRECNSNHNASGYRAAASIRSLASKLYDNLVKVSPALRKFLRDTGGPRRLVIQTKRPEMH